MEEKERLTEIYREMYHHMISKNINELGDLLDDSFVLIHMTGMHQSKTEFLRAVKNGTLNYFSEESKDISITSKGDTALLNGRSMVSAAVFGGGRGTWRLQLKISLKKVNDKWLLTRAVASTF